MIFLLVSSSKVFAIVVVKRLVKEQLNKYFTLDHNFIMGKEKMIGGNKGGVLGDITIKDYIIKAQGERSIMGHYIPISNARIRSLTGH